MLAGHILAADRARKESEWLAGHILAEQGRKASGEDVCVCVSEIEGST